MEDDKIYLVEKYVAQYDGHVSDMTDEGLMDIKFESFHMSDMFVKDHEGFGVVRYPDRKTVCIKLESAMNFV